jgi:hypothetical protein
LFLSESIAWESDRDAGSTNYLAAKLDAECPYQIVLPRRQLMDDSTIVDFLLRTLASSTCTSKIIVPRSLKWICRGVSMTVSRFVLVDFRYMSDPLGHLRLYEAGNIYDMPPALAHAAAKRDLVAAQRPVDWEPPSTLRPPEVLTEAELAAAEAELKALQRHAFEVVDPESR